MVSCFTQWQDTSSNEVTTIHTLYLHVVAILI